MGGTRARLFSMTGIALLLFLPAVTAQSTGVDERDGNGETALATLDLLRLQASATADVVEVRLHLARTPQAFDAESLGTLTAEYHYVYEVEFQVQPAQHSIAEPSVLTLGAVAWFNVHPEVPCPCWAGVDWAFTWNAREGPLGRSTGSPPASYAVNGTLEGDVLVWRIDRQYLSRTAGVLSPQQEWTLSAGHVGSRLEGYVLDSTIRWATSRRPGEAAGEDRLPDDGYAASLFAPKRSAAEPSPNNAPNKGHEIGAKPPIVVFDGRVTDPTPALDAVSWTAALAAVAALLRPRIAGAMLAGLFSRFLPSEALGHPRRAMIFEALRGGPATFSQLRSLLEIGSGPLAYHLGMLERQDLIKSRRVQSRRVYHLPEQASRVFGFDGPGAKVVEALRAQPGLAAKDVGAVLGVGRTAALYHLERLERGGQVRSVREGRTRRFFAT